MTERELERKALGVQCPECDAKPFKKCRNLGLKHYVGRGPHSERVTVVYRQWLEREREGAAPAAPDRLTPEMESHLTAIEHEIADAERHNAAA